MDMMELRRMVMAQMAIGARFVKGTFTVPSDQGSQFYFQIGKTFEKYLFFVEMTDESKEELLDQTTIAGSRGYSFVGMYPNVVLNEQEDAQNTIAHTIAPSTGSTSRTTGNFNYYGTSTQLGLPCGAVTTNASVRIYQGYSYNYFIVEMP